MCRGGIQGYGTYAVNVRGDNISPPMEYPRIREIGRPYTFPSRREAVYSSYGLIGVPDQLNRNPCPRTSIQHWEHVREKREC